MRFNELIAKYEGLKLSAYKCPAGVWTIGYGTTIYPNGKPVKQGDTCTKSEAGIYLTDYLETIKSLIQPFCDNEQQVIALESLIYNIGWGAFSKSKCWDAIKQRDWTTAIKNWDWYSANGKPLLGLIKRRAEEIGLFFSNIEK